MVISTVGSEGPTRPVRLWAGKLKLGALGTALLIAFNVLNCAAKDGKVNFFDEVSKELVEVSGTTEQKMKDSANNPPVLSGGQATAVQVARGWTEAILKPEVLLTRSTSYVPFPAEDGHLDMIRVWYATDFGEMRIAQSFCAFSLTIRRSKSDALSAESAANAMAKLIFKQNARIDLELSGTENGLSYGKQRTTKETSAHWDWVDLLRWWTDGEVLGFLTLKASAKPGMAIMSWDIEFNRDWFRLYERAE